jgi:hypothetical protein
MKLHFKSIEKLQLVPMVENLVVVVAAINLFNKKN